MPIRLISFEIPLFTNLLYTPLHRKNSADQAKYVPLDLTSRHRPKSAPYPRLKNSKKTSKCQVFSCTVLENRIFFEKKISKKIHTQKMDLVARRGSLARAPGALKSHNAEKLKGGSFGVFKHPFCRKTSKNWNGEKFSFLEKNLSAEKNCKEGPFGIFQHPFCRKTAKNWRWDRSGKNFFTEKKSHNAEKNWKGDHLVSPLWYVTRENRKNLFGSVR